MELGLQDILNRVERIGQSVDDNVNRLADNVQKIEGKVDGLVEANARVEATLDAHTAAEETWRREVSERINLVDVEAKHRTKEARDEAIKVAEEAKTMATIAQKGRDAWGVRWQTVVAMIGLMATVVAACAGYVKCTSDMAYAKGRSSVQVPALPSK